MENLKSWSVFNVNIIYCSSLLLKYLTWHRVLKCFQVSFQGHAQGLSPRVTISAVQDQGQGQNPGRDLVQDLVLEKEWVPEKEWEKGAGLRPGFSKCIFCEVSSLSSILYKCYYLRLIHIIQPYVSKADLIKYNSRWGF